MNVATRRSVDRAPSIARPRLVADALESAARVVVVAAPAGYGKTTLLRRIATAASTPVAEVTIDEAANDPAVLIDRLAVSLAAAGLLGDVAARSAPSIIAGLAAGAPGVVMMDDLELIVHPRALAIIEHILSGAPAGIRWIVGSRGRPQVRLARLRAAGDVLDLGAGELAMTKDEAAELFADVAGGQAPSEHLRQLLQGWPAGLQLARAAYAVGRDPSATVQAVARGHGAIAEYLLEEVLATQPPHRRRFLLDTSILDELQPALCDAVRDADDSAILLDEVVSEGLFVFSSGNDDPRLAYAEAFRDLLRAELDREGAARRRRLHRRAAEWYRRHDRVGDLFDHLIAADERALAIGVLSAHAMALLTTGRLVTVQRWVERFSDEEIRSSPALALAAAWVAAFRGTLGGALRYAALAEAAGPHGPLPDGSASVEASVSILRSAVCTASLEEAAAHASRAIALEPRESPWRPSAHLQLGTIRLIAGDLDAAEAELEHAVALAADVQPAVHVSALAYIAAVRFSEGTMAEATALARRVARRIREAELDAFPPMAFPFGVAGRILASERHPDSSAVLMQGLQLLRGIAFVFPPSDAWIRTVIADGLIDIGEDARAREVVADTHKLLRRHSMDPRLAELLAAVERRLDTSSTLREPLTPRELEILVMLAAVGSLNDIADELVVSVNTVKTHVRSIYQKLGVSSRKAAVRRARELRLVV